MENNNHRVHNVDDEEEEEFECNRKYAALTWKILQEKFTLLDIPSMAFEVYTALDDLQKKHMIDVSVLKKKFQRVLEMIEKVKESESAQRNNVEDQSATRKLHERREEEDRFYATLRAELMDVDDQLLVSKKQKIESFLAKLENDNQQNSDEISQIQRNISNVTLNSSAQRNISNVTLNSSARKQLQHKIEDLNFYMGSIIFFFELL